MEKPTIDQVIAVLQEKFGAALLDVETAYDFKVIHLPKDRIKEVIHFLYYHDLFPFQYLTTLCGLHFPQEAKPFGVMIQIHCLSHNLRLRFKSFTTADDLLYETLTDIFPSSNWMERETFDFFGIRFAGHPNLTRILNLEDMDYHPMRKEYPIEDATRYDKDDSLFGRTPAAYDRKRLETR